jgi:uncharacterized tellurite resistance protein B-like protein
VSLLRFIGLGSSRADASSETETVRRIARELEGLDPGKARYLAGFAYVLARVANADLRIEASESVAMEEIVRRIAGLTEAEAALVVEIAKSQARLLGGTENYVVTREFKNASTREQRVQLLECLFEVAASDGTIATVESGEIAAIGEELGFTRAEINALRAPHRDKLAELQKT